MSTTYTDLQLQRFLASCLPEKITFQKQYSCANDPIIKFRWITPLFGGLVDREINHTEWLQIFWEVEEKLTGAQCLSYEMELNHITGFYQHLTAFVSLHATWQQRTIALAQALGRRIDE